MVRYRPALVPQLSDWSTSGAKRTIGLTISAIPGAEFPQFRSCRNVFISIELVVYRIVTLMSGPPSFFWFIPTPGDGSYLGSSVGERQSGFQWGGV